ncbi:MAG: hypothetical protein ACP5GO_00570 [Thermoprotei archaeon]|jgi:hypothetical protein
MEEEIFPIIAKKNASGEVEVWYTDGEKRYKALATRIEKIPLFRWCKATLKPIYNYGPDQTAQFTIEDIQSSDRKEKPGIKWLLIDMISWPRFKVYNSTKMAFAEDVDGDSLFRAISYYDPDILGITTRSRRGLDSLALDHAKELRALGRDGKGTIMKGWGIPKLDGRIAFDPLELSHLTGFYDPPDPGMFPDIVDALEFLMQLTSSYSFLLTSGFSSLASLLHKRKDNESPYLVTGIHNGPLYDSIVLPDELAWLFREANSRIRMRMLSQIAEGLPAGVGEASVQAVYRCGGKLVSRSEVGEVVTIYKKALIGKKDREWAGLSEEGLFVGFQTTNPRFSPLSRKYQASFILETLMSGAKTAKETLPPSLPEALSPFHLVVERDTRVEDNILRRRGVIMTDGSLMPPLWVRPDLRGVDLESYKKELISVQAQVLSIFEQTRLGDFGSSEG